MNRALLLATVSLSGVSLAGVSLFAGPALAADAQTAAAAADTGTIQEVVVTATRRSENLQTVPQSVTSVKGEVLKTQGVQSAIDLPQLAPGLVVSRTLASANAYLRGVGTSSSGFTTETPVAVYIDGLYLPNSATAVFSFNNIDRIEVLKGPQGTLYGRNTTGGLISVITRDPGANKALDVSAGYGNYNTYQGNLYVSTPIAQNLAGNLSVSYIDQLDGFDHNVITGDSNLKLRDVGLQGKLMWTPSAETKVTLRGFYDNLRTDMGISAMVFPGSVAPDGTTFLGERLNADRRDEGLKQEQYNLSLKVEQDLGFANLMSLTGYIYSHANMVGTQSPYPGNPVLGQSAVYLDGQPTDKAFSQELQLSSKTGEGSRLKWIGGLFYYHDDSTVLADVYGTCIGTTCAAAPPPLRTIGRPITRSISVYGEATYDVTPSTHLTLGARYTNDHKTFSGIVEVLPGHPNSLAALPPSVVSYPGMPFAGYPNGIPTSITNAEPTWRAVLAQDLGSDVHAYLSYNRGFKSGGFNPISFTNPPSRPEILDAYAVGLKTFLFDHRLRFNTEAFYYDYKDIQLRTSAPPAPPGGTILFNAAEAHIKGVDGDFAWAATSDLTLNGGFEVLDARFVKFPGGTCTVPRTIGGPILGGNATVACNLVGHLLPQAPKLSFNLGANYTIRLSAGSVVLAANDSYQSKQYWDPDNRLSEGGYHLVNASLTWNLPGDHFSAQVYARNLLNTYTYAGVAEGSADALVPGAPRTYGVSVRYRY